MKRKILSILILLIALSSLFALPDFTNSKLWIPTSVNLGQGNDKWTFGFSRNNDDQLSYSTNTVVDAPLWTFNLDANGITNRGWKEAWFDNEKDPDPDNWYDGRYDVIDIGFALKIPIYEQGNFSFNVTPKVGLVLAGDYGYYIFQNLVHYVSNIHEVNIPYENGGERIVSPKLSASLSASYDFPLTDEGTKLKLAVEFESENNINFETTQYLGASLMLHQDVKPFFSLSIGYLWMQGYTGWKTQELFHRYNEGWQFGFKVNMGAFAIDYYKVLGSSFGYNVYSVDFMSFFKKSSYRTNDLTLFMGYSRQDKRNYNSIRFLYEIDHSNFSLIATSRYMAGNPINPKSEENADLNEDWRLKLAYASWALGINYDFPDSWSKGWFTPYINLSLGLQRFEFAVLTNMVPTSSKPCGEVHDYLMFLDAEIGFSFFPEGLIKAENATYRLFCSYGISFYPDSERLTNYINISHLNDFFNTDFTRDHYFLHRFSIGVMIGLDL